MKNNIQRPGFSLMEKIAQNPTLNKIMMESLSSHRFFEKYYPLKIAMPNEWKKYHLSKNTKLIYYNSSIQLDHCYSNKNDSNSWFVISNARFASKLNYGHLKMILAELNSPAVAFYTDPALSAYREKIILTSDNKVAGFRRFYSDSIMPIPNQNNWPDHLFIRNCLLNDILVDDCLPSSYELFEQRCTAASISISSYKIAAYVLDLETDADLLNFLTKDLNRYQNAHSGTAGNNNTTPQNTRIIGNVVLGSNVRLNNNTRIIGPAIIADNTTISDSALISSSVIGPDMKIPTKSLIKNRIILSHSQLAKTSPEISTVEIGRKSPPKNSTNFRLWPCFSYARLIKRLADIAISLIVIILFIPFLPMIAILIRIDSPGRIFFGHKRQGLRGKEFSCIKFRTMIPEADSIQQKLRSKNQVDGPQFKVDNDPRVTLTGRFLRDTFIDEIPQFLNILKGDMSLIGPRPSPKAENSLCPYWRDARLSVRPGITGLWQIYRTRQPGKDFQEWIYYDVDYVRNISLLLDCSICIKTAKKLISNFFEKI